MGMASTSEVKVKRTLPGTPQDAAGHHSIWFTAFHLITTLLPNIKEMETTQIGGPSNVSQSARPAVAEQHPSTQHARGCTPLSLKTLTAPKSTEL